MCIVYQLENKITTTIIHPYFSDLLHWHWDKHLIDKIVYLMQMLQGGVCHDFT